MRNETVERKPGSDISLHWCFPDVFIEPGEMFGPVIRDHYILEMCTQGREQLLVNGKGFYLNEGEGMFLFPGETHTHVTEGNTPRCGYYCAITGFKVAMLLGELGITSSSPYIPKEACPAIVEIMRKMYTVQSEGVPGTALKLTACAYEVFGELMKYAAPKREDNEYVRHALNIMEARYYQELTVEGIARELSIHRVHFSRLFRQTTGKTPQEYLIDLRLKKACDLLRMGKNSISEIADAVGIRETSFSRVFKQKIGMTPTQYRARNRR